MTQEKAKKIHLIYSCIVAVLIIALGIALMISFWNIYQSGDRPYTRASIGEKLQQISLLIYLTVASVVGGAVLNLIVPLDRAKTRAVRDELVAMKKLAEKVTDPNTEEVSAIQKERNIQKFAPLCTGVCYAALLIYPAIYMLNKANFSGVDPTAEIMKAALMVLPFCLIGLVLCYICSMITTASILRQTAVYKQMLAAGKKAGAVAATSEKKHLPLGAVRCAILVIALVCIVVGIFNGSAQDVLTKAIKICTECIGLG